MSKKPHYGIHPEGWTFQGTFGILGMAQDYFCIDKKYHANITKDVPPGVGLHISVRTYCDHADGKNASQDECIEAVQTVFRGQEIPWMEPFPSSMVQGVWHLNEDITITRTRRN